MVEKSSSVKSAQEERLSRRDFLKVSTALTAGVLAGPSAAWVVQHNAKGPFPENIRASRAKLPNVLLIVLDTVRADHMSCYGYHRKTTPNIDEFVRSARLYQKVLSPSFWTVPSHASLFTGLPASAHGANWPNPFLHQQFDVLPEQLRAEGYQTVGLSCNGAFVTPHRGFARGFDLFWNPANKERTLSYEFLRRLGVDMERDDFWSAATNMHRRLGKWFREDYQPDKPFFIFLNYIEAHFPYRPPLPSPIWSKFEAWNKWDNFPVNKMLEYTLAGSNALSTLDISQMQTLYDEEILYLDRKVKELLDFLQTNGLDENTLIIITSDHGEHFGEHHLLGHWQYVYEPLVRVPLIVRYQDRFAPGTEERLVQSHDIYPTILQLANVPWQPKAAHNCRSLLGQDRQEPRTAVSEMVMTWLDPIVQIQHRFPEMDLVRLTGPTRAIQVGDQKLIVHADGAKELYDLETDPRELKNYASERSGTVKILAKNLNDWLSSFNQYQPTSIRGENDLHIPSNELKAIKTLGYTK